MGIDSEHVGNVPFGEIFQRITYMSYIYLSVQVLGTNRFIMVYLMWEQAPSFNSPWTGDTARHSGIRYLVFTLLWIFTLFHQQIN